MRGVSGRVLCDAQVRAVPRDDRGRVRASVQDKRDVGPFDRYFIVVNRPNPYVTCHLYRYAVNVKPCIFLTQEFARALADANKSGDGDGLGGAIVHVSSQSSTLALPDHLVYSSSKAAVDHITHVQALELSRARVRVNAVRPTVVLTPLARANWAKADLEKVGQCSVSTFSTSSSTPHAYLIPSSAYFCFFFFPSHADLGKMTASVPLARLATPEDVAAAVAWLLSDEASMVTGALLPVDGGRSMGL